MPHRRRYRRPMGGSSSSRDRRRGGDAEEFGPHATGAGTPPARQFLLTPWILRNKVVTFLLFGCEQVVNLYFKTSLISIEVENEHPCWVLKPKASPSSLFSSIIPPENHRADGNSS